MSYYFDNFVKPCLLDRYKVKVNPLMDFLVAGWKFEDNFNDILGNNNGTEAGIGSNITFIDFAIGKGIDLRGRNRTVILDNNIPFEIGYSICFYMDFPSITGTVGYLVGSKSSTFTGGIFHNNGIGVFDSVTIGTGVVPYTTTDPITHVAITRTGIGTYDVFINSNFTGQIVLTTSTLTIDIGGFGARRLLSAQFFVNTILDEIYVFNKILTEQEILTAMQGL